MNDQKKTINVIVGMSWYDTSPPTTGVRFPAGGYLLEAEDDEYLYFRSSAPLEISLFKNGTMADKRNIQGGIMISKHPGSAIPAGAYIDNEKSKKMMIWKLGSDFLRREGKDWKKSF